MRIETDDLAKIRREYFQVLGGSMAVLLAVHFVPKNANPWSVIRLFLTILYFGAAFTLLYSLTLPLKRYLTAAYTWRFEGSSPSINKAWQSFIFSLSRATTWGSGIFMILVAACAVRVFGTWLPALRVLDVIAIPARWVGFIGIILFPFVGSFLIAECLTRYRMLREQIDSDEFSPRSLANIYKDDPALSRATVERIGDLRFWAGAYEWCWDDFYKNCIVFGQSGTGKTLCVLNALLDGLLVSGPPEALPSGLILDPKGDFHNKAPLLLEKHGRTEDLLILDPGDIAHSVRWNPFDSEDDELELAGRFASVLKSTGMKEGQESFWIDSARKFIRHAIALIRLTNPPDQPPTFGQIGELATSFNKISERADSLPHADARSEQCLNFFANEWSELATETRSSVQAHITNMVDPFLMEPYATLFSGRSTVKVADIIDSGKILYLYMPIADKETMARMVCSFIKLEFYREILKRPEKPRPSFFFCDEFQSFFTATAGKGDADFFERSRQSNHANIVATQNRPALLKQVEKREPVENLLGNCAVKIFLRNTDRETNEWASEQFGEKLVDMVGNNLGGGGGGGGRLGWLKPQSRGNQSSNSQYDKKVRPERFTELRVPERGDTAPLAEAIVHLASRSEVLHKTLKWKVHPIS